MDDTAAVGPFLKWIGIDCEHPDDVPIDSVGSIFDIPFEMDPPGFLGQFLGMQQQSGILW